MAIYKEITTKEIFGFALYNLLRGKEYVKIVTDNNVKYITVNNNILHRGELIVFEINNNLN